MYQIVVTTLEFQVNGVPSCLVTSYTRQELLQGKTDYPSRLEEVIRELGIYIA